MKRIITLIMTTVLVMTVLTGCGNSSESSLGGDSPTKYAVKYNLKINPEFEIYADEDLNIINVEALNDDAANVLGAVDVTGMPVADAFSMLTEEAKAEGYMTVEKGNTVDINIEEMQDESMSVCPVCSGKGTIVCWDCNGAGGWPCERCTGSGGGSSSGSDDEICQLCYGTGYTITPDDGCWACHGSGVCYLCGGTGYDIVTNEYGEVVYVSEGVPETYTCTFCHGSGTCTNCLGIQCRRCNNTESSGDEHATPDGSCPGCAGTGFVTCGCELNGYRWCPCCWGSGVDGTGYENYDYSLSAYENFLNNR